MGMWGFNKCVSLTSVDIPNLDTLLGGSFFFCYSMDTINFPKLIFKQGGAFRELINLKYVSFGTALEKETKTLFYGDFDLTPTENCDLVLGECVYSPPNIEERT